MRDAVSFKDEAMISGKKKRCFWLSYGDIHTLSEAEKEEENRYYMTIVATHQHVQRLNTSLSL